MTKSVIGLNPKNTSSDERDRAATQLSLGKAEAQFLNVSCRSNLNVSVLPARRSGNLGIRSKLLPALLLIFGCVCAHGQANYGSILGTVTDPTGALIAGADVSVHNDGTNAVEQSTTGSSGTFTFANLNPGVYDVTVAHQGFTSTTRSQVEVQIGGSTRVDVVLSIGKVAQAVTVQAAQTELQTDSSTLGGVVAGKQVLNAPLNGRNVDNLLDFIPGVVPGGGTQASTVSNGGSANFQVGSATQSIAFGNYQIGGGFSGQSLFYVDGVESNIPENNVNTLVPTQDAVQEFRVSTNNVSAEFGGFAGGVVQMATKSGTNTFHGSAYEYFRNTSLDANDWFSNHQGLPKPPLHQNQYGVNLGGPIVKSKAFFFFSWEHESLTSGGLSTNTVPTTAELGGDFSGISQPIYDLSTPGAPQFSCNGINNVICPDRIDPVAAKILSLESPKPNRSGLTNNFVATAPIEGVQNQYNARVDYSPTHADLLFARYTFWNPHNGPSDPFGNKTGAGPTGSTTHEFVLGDNHVFNSTTIADLRLSYLTNYNFQIPLSSGFDMSSLGSPWAALQKVSLNPAGVLPSLGIQGYSIGAQLSQLLWFNTAYSMSGSITKILGRHTLKFGGSGRQIEWTEFDISPGVTLGALPSFTASSSNPNSGNALASLLLGIPSSAGITQEETVRSFLHPFAFYAIDTFQVNKKLTLNLGLRWEQPGSYSEVNNLATVLLPDAPNPLGSIYNPVLAAKQTLKGNMAFVASPQYPSRREESLHWRLFSPRVGFAYRISDKNVVRGGYGIAYLPAEYTADSPAASPVNSAGTSLFNIVGQNPVTTVSNPFPNGILLPSGRNPAGLTALLGQSLESRIPNQPYSYVQQFNLGVERSLGSNSTISLAYGGSKGTHLMMTSGYTGTVDNLNQLPDKYLSMGSDLLTQVQNPFYGVLPAGPLGGQTIAKGLLLKPYPQYQYVWQTVPHHGDSTYHSLQATFVRRFNNGGILQVAYTWSKLLSNTDNTSSFQDGQGSLGVVQDYNNLKAEKSLSQQDLDQNAVISYSLDLPFGAGRRFLSDTNKLTSAIISGWRANGITTYRSGIPIAIVAGPNSTNEYFGAGFQIRPNYTQGCRRKTGGSAQSKVNKWFNTSCFTQPADFSFGNENRVDPQLRSAGAANYDFSLDRTFKIVDSSEMTFSAEAFNLFNRAQFAEPGSSMSDPTFGQVLHQSNLPRTLQFSLRVSF